MLRAIATAVILLFGAACGLGGGQGPAGDIVLRWIDDPPQIVLELSDLFPVEPVFQWTFTHPVDLEAWDFRDVRDASIADGKLRLRSTSTDPRLVRRVELDAASIHRIDVVMSVPGNGTLELAWTRQGEEFSVGRSIRLEADQGRGLPNRTFTFELRSHPEWCGTISRIRFDPTDRSDDTAEVVSITGGRHLADAGAVEKALRTPWTVVLGHEARSALIALPETPSVRRLRIPEGAVLSFAYGLQPGMEQAVRFDAFVETGGRVERLFSRSLDPARKQADRWYRASVDLSDSAGRELTLRLETTTETTLDRTRGFPVWGSPEISGIGRQAGPNVLLICLDTLRADRLSSYGYDLPTSPNVDAWAAESAALFRNTVATAPWTLPSHVSMFSGLESMRHGVNHYGSVPPSLELVAETLRRAGYATAAVTGGGYLRPEFGFVQGFDTFHYWPDHRSEEALEASTDRAIDWLSRNHRQRFFLFFHTYEIHSPHRRREPHFSRFAKLRDFDPPDSSIEMRRHDWQGLRAPGDYFVVHRRGSTGWDAELTGAEVELASLMYDSAVAYTDVQLRRLFELLDRLGLRRDTVVIVTSDHGEALGEDGRAGHAYLDDFNVLVPLMIALPGGRGAGEIVDRQVRLTDLTPTILDAVGLPADRPMDGVSLLHLMDGEPTRVPEEAWTYAASSNRGIGLRLDNRLKYIVTNAAWRDIAGEHRLYDLEADPHERHDLAATDPRAGGLGLRSRRAMLDQHQGYRVAIRNAGPEMLVGRLGGVLAARSRVKTADMWCRCVWWRTGQRPTFALRPGHGVTLLVESPEVAHAAVNLRVVDDHGNTRARIRQKYELDQISLPVAWAFHGGRWERVPEPKRPPATGFMLWIEGDQDAVARQRVIQDDRMRRQLRALGYVE